MKKVTASILKQESSLLGQYGKPIFSGEKTTRKFIPKITSKGYILIEDIEYNFEKIYNKERRMKK